MIRHFRNRGALFLATGHRGPNMTPMVDVTMVILVFFMASTAILGPELLLRASVASESAAADPPPSDAAASPDAGTFALEPPTVTIRLRVDEGRVVADGLGVTGGSLAQVRDVLQAFASDLGLDAAPAGPAAQLPARATDADESDADEQAVRVLIEADSAVPWEAVVAVHDTALAVGLRRVAIR